MAESLLRNARNLSSDLLHEILDEMRTNDVNYQKIHACLVLIKRALLLISKLRFIIINKNFSIQGFLNQNVYSASQLVMILKGSFPIFTGP